MRGRGVRRAAWACAAVALGAALLGGCGADGEAPDGPAPTGRAVTQDGAGSDGGTSQALAAPTIASTGTIYRQRTLEADRKVEVRVTATSEPRGIVTSVSMTSPYFGPSGTVPTNVLLIDGDESRLRVPLGEPICPPGQGPTVATVEVRAKAGTAITQSDVTLDDAALAEVNTEECAAKVATDAARPELAVDDDGRVVAVTLTRGSSDATATLTRLGGNIIFALDPAQGALPVTLAPGQATTSVPVAVRADRCDAHAFAESKKTYVFPAWFEVDGAEVFVEYRASGDAEEALYELFAACGEANESQSIGGQ